MEMQATSRCRCAHRKAALCMAESSGGMVCHIPGRTCGMQLPPAGQPPPAGVVGRGVDLDDVAPPLRLAGWAWVG